MNDSRGTAIPRDHLSVNLNIAGAPADSAFTESTTSILALVSCGVNDIIPNSLAVLCHFKGLHRYKSKNALSKLFVFSPLVEPVAHRQTRLDR